MRLPMRRPCMSVKAVTTVSISPLSTATARSSRVITAAPSPRLLGWGRGGSRRLPAPFHEPCEECPRPRLVGDQLLRMRLHRHDHPVRRLDCLDDAIGARGGGPQAWCQNVNCLVVDAVDHQDRWGNPPELRVRVDGDAMGKTPARMALPVVALDVLEQRAPQGDVDELLAPADAEHRDPGFDGAADESRLRLVQRGVDLGHPADGSAAVLLRTDIPAAGNDQAVDAGKDSRGVSVAGV